MTDVELSGSARRLAEELEDHGVALQEVDGVRDVLLDELDYARRVPMFEGRRPVYGSFSMPPGTDIHDADGIADLVSLEGMPRDMARTFADGRSAFVVNHHEQPPELVCFDRPVQYEAELVVLQQTTGARIVQRSAVFGQVRLFTEQRVVSWDGQAWSDRPTAAALLRALLESVPDIDPQVARGLLDLTVHWLAPARIGATIVVHESNFEWASMDVSTKFRAPRLSLKNRQHYPALFASLQQTRPGDARHCGGWHRVPRRRSPVERGGRAEHRSRATRDASSLGATLQLRPPVDHDRRRQRERAGDVLPRRTSDRPRAGTRLTVRRPSR